MPAAARALLVCVLVTACASSSRMGRGEDVSIAGLEALRPGMLVVFGDIHGTNEIPAFVADTACALARKGRVHVGLEIPIAETSALQAFLASEDDRALRGDAFWTRSYQDGRTSEAVLGLLRKVREARKSGLPVDVFFFDDPDRLGMDRRDEAMAENISAERRRAPADIYLVEVGNLHAKSSIGAAWDPAKRWMASYLKSRERDFFTLDVRGPPGSAWLCRTAKSEDCGVVNFGSSPEIGTREGSLARAVKLVAVDGYDGTYQVERLTASRPAFVR